MVRIYPNEELSKNRPEAWAARFTLRSKDGAVEAVRETPLSIDSNTGLVAASAMPLDGAGITPGEHVLEVELSGPGDQEGVSRVTQRGDCRCAATRKRPGEYAPR